MLPDPGALRVEVVVNGIECAGNFNRPCLGTVQRYVPAALGRAGR